MPKRGCIQQKQGPSSSGGLWKYRLLPWLIVLLMLLLTEFVCAEQSASHTHRQAHQDTEQDLPATSRMSKGSYMIKLVTNSLLKSAEVTKYMPSAVHEHNSTCNPTHKLWHSMKHIVMHLLQVCQYQQQTANQMLLTFSKMSCDQLELAAHDLRRRAIAAARKHSSVQAALDKAMNAAAGQHQTQQECMLAAEASKSQLLLDIDGALSKETATQAALLHCALRIHDLEAELAEVHQQSLISIEVVLMSYAGIQNPDYLITIQTCGLEAIPQRVIVTACSEVLNSLQHSIC